MKRFNTTIRCMDGTLYSETQDAESDVIVMEEGGDPIPLTEEEVAVVLFRRLSDLGAIALHDEGSLPRSLTLVPVHNVHSIIVTDVTDTAREA